MRKHDIPGFDGYLVIQPFDIIDRKTGEPVKRYTAHRGQRGNPRVHVYDNSGRRRTISIVSLAALAFHGQSPNGYVAYHSGGEITPSSIKWVPQSQANRIWRQNFTEWQRLEMCDLYFADGWTQQRIANKYGLSQKQVSLAIRGGQKS